MLSVTVYGAAKLAGEHYTNAYWQTYGSPTITVRSFNAYGGREPTKPGISPRLSRALSSGFSTALRR